MHVILGDGKYLITVGKEIENNDESIIFEHSEKSYPIGAAVPKEENSGTFIPKEQDLVITFKNIESARVLQDEVNLCILRMLGKVDSL